MNDEITLTLNSPITEEQWDAINDVDFDHTDRIWFHTKHGKDVEFVKDSSALHESCTDCPLYDHDKYRCPRFNKVIPTAIQDALPRWIPVSERLPDNRVDVLICYREWQQYAKRYVYAIVNGWYARKHSVKENVFSEWEADCDYKEDEDEFYIQEGWYEFTTQGNGDLMNWYIGGAEVVAWMPLPEPYKEGENDG